MDQLAQEGMAVLMISSDLEEILGMSDRVLVMHESSLAGELPCSGLTWEGSHHALGPLGAPNTMKKLLGITVFLILVYVALLMSHQNAASADTHFLIGQRLGLFGILSLAAGLLIIAGGIGSFHGLFGLSVLHGFWSVGREIFLVDTSGVNGDDFSGRRSWDGQWTSGDEVAFAALHGDLVRSVHIPQPGTLAHQGFQDRGIGPLRSRDLSAFFEGAIFGVPVYLIILLGFVVIAVIFLVVQCHRPLLRRPGQQTNKAARFSGIATDRYKILSYVICSFLTAIYSFLAIMNSPSVAPSSAGEGYELIAIAGRAVLGGCSLRGGEGKPFGGIIVGTLIIRILLSMMNTFWDIPVGRRRADDRRDFAGRHYSR